jgi:hypothetical protein
MRELNLNHLPISLRGLHNLGMKHTEETKFKMSIAHKGMKHTEETKRKISKTMKEGVK